MVVESPKDVARYLALQTLNPDELKTQCEAIGHTITDQSKAYLIKTIMEEKSEAQYSQGLLPQSIPLRTRDQHGKPIPKTADNYRHWRKLIWDAPDNLKHFDFIGKNRNQYSTRVYYIGCTANTALHIIQNKWYSFHEVQKELIKEIQQNPGRFAYHIIQKNAANGNNFIELHCQLKED